MTKRERLLQKVKQSPNNVTFDQVKKLLEAESFRLERIAGSHYIFRKKNIIFAIPGASESREGGVCETRH